jgi:hypothetical protein
VIRPARESVTDAKAQRFTWAFLKGRMNDLSRRRLLTAGGSGTALTLAGCLSFGDDDANGDADPPNSDESPTMSQDGSGEFSATVVADVPEEEAQAIQEELQSRREEIRQQVQDGEIEQSEAQTQMQEAQASAQEDRLALLEESVGSIQDHVGGVDDLAVTESAGDSGIVLVGGAARPILELLGRDRVAGLVSAAQFEELQQRGP